ncbi:uncharacterized protein [Drosophila takahashii]|uniref:uncharacterized protein n=1 Tax=Drosophila takahashii TaxID=29030 RepID=UPI001CF909C0|nr:uncharacterized protein LOC108069538 [Drosophila takahashii]
MEALLDMGDPYMCIIGLPADLHRHWTSIGNFLSQEENGEPQNEPNLEGVTMQPEEDIIDLEVVPLTQIDPEEPSFDLSAAGDGPHIIPQTAEIGNPALIIFRPRRGSVLRVPWFSLERLMPVIITVSSVLFKKILDLFGIDISQVFALGLSYNAHIIIFQCVISFASYWIKDFFSAQNSL